MKIQKNTKIRLNAKTLFTFKKKNSAMGFLLSTDPTTDTTLTTLTTVSTPGIAN